jgi:hypothetical protein
MKLQVLSSFLAALLFQQVYAVAQDSGVNVGDGFIG